MGALGVIGIIVASLIVYTIVGIAIINIFDERNIIDLDYDNKGWAIAFFPFVLMWVFTRDTGRSIAEFVVELLEEAEKKKQEKAK